MPKILRIINRFNLGGITYNVSYLSRYLPENYETLLVGGPEEKDEESSLYIPHSLDLNPIVIQELKRSINPFQDYLAYRKLKAIIREFKPDIVHTHASKAGFIGRLAARHCKVPVIVHTFHGNVFDGYFPKLITRIIKTIERVLAGYSNAIVAISTEQKKQLYEVHKICDEKKVKLIPLGFDLNRFTIQQDDKRKEFRSKYNLAVNDIDIGIICRLAPIKNHLLFLNALIEVSKTCTVNFRAFIIGDGKTRESLENYLNEKGVLFSSVTDQKTEKIKFTGWIKEVDVALAGLDLVCLSSKNEGTPVSLIEAQAAGKFIVSTNVGGIKDILHKNCGLLSESEDLEGFTKNLVYALENFEILKNTMNEAREEVLKKFSYQRLCDDMTKLYSELVTN